MYNLITKTAARTAYNSSLKHSLMIFIIGIFLLPGIASASPVLPERLIELTNAERQKNNLNALSYNPLLAQAAEAKAEAILSSGKFEHNINGRRFSTWIKDTGYGYSYVGENLAIDFETSEGIFEAWMDSESHKNNILNNHFQEIGIARVEGEYNGEKTIVVAQVFGAPLSAVLPAQTQASSSSTISTIIKDKIYKTYYILAAESKSAVSRVEKSIPDGSRSLIFESFKLASMIFFTISIILFYMYLILHLFIFPAIVRLE